MVPYAEVCTLGNIVVTSSLSVASAGTTHKQSDGGYGKKEGKASDGVD